ncbi:hypothetical protein GLOIN_2v1776857 [Rhizophagus clarus]|uniref:Uncharacterized protein n=1 Tax=Rhizophagus clarus TaxID=94130 RepID=A0A8H3QJV8_9GLOM|nr:hypothetical protein GLOIN_2v1776857 [Rhizophagus clarus]
MILKILQNTFIKKLLIKSIKHGFREGQEKINILPNIKEYIMKKKRAKYLAYQDYFHFETEFIVDDQLISFEDEIKEFRLHAIIVQDYDIVCIDYK